MPSRTLAKMLRANHPQLFTSIEQARSLVRYYRGKLGSRHSNYAKEIVPYRMFESEAPRIEPYQFRTKGKGLVIADLHIPYHDPRAVETAIGHAQREGHTDFLIILGDMLDCYRLSRWDKDPRKRSFAGELDLGRRLLKEVSPLFGETFYKLGNHEFRYEYYMMTAAPELFGAPWTDWQTIMGLDELGVTLIPQWQIIKAGSLTLLHGHEWGAFMTNPVNPARGLFTRAKASAMCGHFHQPSHHSEGTIDDKRMACWSLGCLCKTPMYSPLAFTKWAHGFALLELDGKMFHVHNHTIINGQVL